MMSRIARISVLTHVNELGGRVWNPVIRWKTKHAVFVRLEDESGRIGVGECWCFDSEPDTLVAYLRTEVAPSLTGCSLADIDQLGASLQARATLSARHGLLASAWSGVDIAAWDLRARIEGASIAEILHADADDTFALYASGGLYGCGKGIDELVHEMMTLVREGFSIVKMKIGGMSIEQDLERARAVLSALPCDVRLIVDGVYRYRADDARRIFDALPAERIEAFQSPIAASDIDGMARLTRAGVPVMATEAEYRPELHNLLLERKAVRFLQTAPVACGGITRLRELERLVAGTPVRLSLEVSSTAIALMAACQFAASSPTVAHVEYHSLHRVFFERLALRVDSAAAGRYRLPQTEGLGVDLPASELHCVVDLSHEG